MPESKLNLSHATANYQKREFTANEDISVMAIKMFCVPSTAIQAATQCYAMQCDQSINQSIENEMGLEVLGLGLIVANASNVWQIDGSNRAMRA